MKTLLLLGCALAAQSYCSGNDLCLLELHDGYQLDATTLDPSFVRSLGILNLQVFDCYHEIAKELQAQPEDADRLKEAYLQHLRSQAAVRQVSLNQFIDAKLLTYTSDNDHEAAPDTWAHLRTINLLRTASTSLNHPDTTGRRIKVSLLNSGISRTFSKVTLNKEYSINFNGLQASLYMEDLPGTVGAALAFGQPSDTTSGVARNGQLVERTVFRPKMEESEESSGLVASGCYETSLIDILEGYSIKETSARFLNVLGCMYELPFPEHLRFKEDGNEPLFQYLRKSMAAYAPGGHCAGDFISIYSTGEGSEDVNLLNYLQSSTAVYVQSSISPERSPAGNAGTDAYSGTRVGSNVLFSSPAGTQQAPLQTYGFDNVEKPLAYGPGSALAIGIGAVTLIADAFAAFGHQMSFSDLVNVLAETGRHTERGSNASYLGGAGDWKRNAAGYVFSNTYGFGEVDVDAAIAYVKALRYIYNTSNDYMERTNWEQKLRAQKTPVLGCTGIANDISCDSSDCGIHRLTVNRYIPDRVTLQKKVTISKNKRIEKIGIRLNVPEDSNLSELSIVIQSPEGTRGTVIKQGSVTSENINDVFFYSYLFYGENSAGQWVISCLDIGYQYSVFIDYIDLAIFGVESYLSVQWPAALTIPNSLVDDDSTVAEKLARRLGMKGSTASSGSLSYVCTDMAVTEEYNLLYINGTETSKRAQQTAVTLATGIKFDCTGAKVNGKNFSMALVSSSLQNGFEGHGRLIFIPSKAKSFDRTTFRGDIFVSSGMHLTCEPPAMDDEPSDDGDEVGSGVQRRARLAAASVTILCVLVAAALGGAFKT